MPESSSLGQKRLLEIKVKKTGPYFGYARGKVDAFELGVERQYKKIKIVRPITHGVHLGFDYNFKNHVLGYQMGYWVKEGRLGLTFGGDLVFRTDFSENRFGGGPCIGYRLLGFHLQTGYHLLSKADSFTNTNDFFIRLRFTIVNERDWDVNSDFSIKDMFKRDKKKKKKK